jgi:hypothetical protein
MPVKVTVSGPLFDGRAARALDELPDQIASVIASEGERRVKLGLDATLRKPTGAYRSRVTHLRVSAGRAVVSDQNSIYGPWLEGTGSRNRTTRFKGYRNWRSATQQLKAGAPALARNIVAANLHKMGG